MSVSSAMHGNPAAQETSTSERASAWLCSGLSMVAPLPHFTSSTSDRVPAASFLDRIEAVISAIESTVAVTSRIAYRRRSAGARSPPAATMAIPASRTTARRVGRSTCER